MGLLFTSILIDTNAQNVIYKSDSTQIFAKTIDNQGKTRKYTLDNETEGLLHYISTSSIDSIIYADGKIERFFKSEGQKTGFPEKSNLLEKSDEINTVKNNFIGVRPISYIYGVGNFFYERYFPPKSLGWKTNVVFNLPGFDDYLYEVNPVFLLESGINYYFLKSSYFRFSAGAALVGGITGRREWNEYTSTPKINKSFSGGALLNGSFWVIFNNLYGSLGLDIPMGLPQYTYFTKLEIAINF